MRVNPYLHFNSQCEAAFQFYAQCLGGQIVAMMPHRGSPAEAHAPAEPGDYEYVCTFPGHYVIMWGKLVVTKDVDAYLQANPK